MRSNRLAGIIRFGKQATNTSITTKYADVAYGSLTYKMALAMLTREC